MLSWSGYQGDLSSSLIVGQQLGDVPPGGLQVPVHRDGQPAVLAAAPHPRTQDGVLGGHRRVEEEEGTCQETGKVTLQCVQKGGPASALWRDLETNGFRVSDAGGLSHLPYTHLALFPLS